MVLASLGPGPRPRPLPHTAPACVLPAPGCPLLSHCWDARCTTFQLTWRLEGKGEASGERPGVGGAGVEGSLRAACSGAGVGTGRARTLDLLGPHAADGGSDQLALLVLRGAPQLWVRGGPQVLGCESRSSLAQSPPLPLAQDSPVRSAPPHRSWTPAVLPAVPEQPAAQPPAAGSCGDTMTGHLRGQGRVLEDVG